jgi:hypothetical protein
VYALGAILYELLTARLPVPADPPELYLNLVQTVRPAGPRGLVAAVPRDLESICLRCLAKHPRDRYLTGDELAADLARFLAGRPVSARPLGPAEAARRAAGRYPVAAALAACTVASLAGGVLATTRLYRAADAARVEAEAARAEEAAARRAAEEQTALTTRQIRHTAFVSDFFQQGVNAAADRLGRAEMAAEFRTLIADDERAWAGDPQRLRWLRLRGGQTLRELGDAAGAERLFRALAADAGEDSRLARLSAAYELSELLREGGRPAEAIRQAEAGLAEADRTLGPRDPRTVNLRLTLANGLRAVGRTAEAAEHAARAMTDYVRVDGREVVVLLKEAFPLAIGAAVGPAALAAP